MDFNSIFGEPPKVLDDNVLLNPLEENLNIPAVAIKIYDFQCADLKIIGYEINNGIIVRIIYPYESHILRIEFSGLVSGDTDPRVLYDIRGRVGRWMLAGLPRKSSKVCILTAPLLYLPNAHVASFMLVDMVVESNA